MLRTAAISLLLSLGATTADARKPAPPRPATAAAFPLPKDASADVLDGGGTLKIYQVPRGRDVVIAELRQLFKAGGFVITKDDPSPSNRAVRLEVTKDKKLYKVGISGDAKHTSIVVTLP